jgi:internalin A
MKSRNTIFQGIEMKRVFLLAIELGLLSQLMSCNSFSSPTKLESVPQPVSKSFTQWCNEKESLPAGTKFTVDLLLKEADTKDCKLADAKLSKLNSLDLYYDKITNIEPLASLSNLTSLDLIGNQISDLKPLAGLINLTYLSIGKNQISDLQPLAGLVKLNYLSLHGNQITDVKSLAGLSNLNNLILNDNQIVGQKCPVPEYICTF